MASSNQNIHVRFLPSEPFLEAVPQLHILLFIWSYSGGNGSCGGLEVDEVFYMTFFTSVLTGSFGISKFLKAGPCQIIRNDSFLMGFGTLGYLLLLMNIACTLVGKGLVLVVYIDDGPGSVGLRLGMGLMLLNFIPQLLHVSFQKLL